ncbi:MAG: thiamine biosynthesis protein [Acidocella sp. 35-58-6]|nr:MAG: thiamine biosynthesis protein [Acidocella sp. 35-58-6]
MSLSRRSVLAATAALPLATLAQADTPKFTVLLDWFVNPDHAPLFAAKYIGAFAAAGLNVDIIAPTDPDIPPRMVAAKKADIALSYQTQLYLLCDQGLPLRRTGTLINQPLNTLMALGTSGITKISDLKGRKIGYSVAGVEDVLIGTMLGSAGLSLHDVTLVNVNFNLVTALISKEVDAVIGGYRNFEENELKEKGFNPVVFLPEDYGVPASDELILMSNAGALNDPRLPKFLNAVKKGGDALRKDPQGMWEKFIADQASLNDTLNKTAWFQSVPYFAANPFYLDVKRYSTYRDFMFAKGLIKHKGDVSAYAVTIPA